VTVFAVASISNIIDFGSKNVPDLLTTVADLMSVASTNNMQLGQGDLTVVLGPEHAELFGREGVSRDAARRFLHLNARKRAGELSPGVLGCVRDWRSQEIAIITPDTLLPVVNDWREINIVVAGGPAGSHSAFFAGFEARSVCMEV
jgi:hypothetical protein